MGLVACFRPRRRGDEDAMFNCRAGVRPGPRSHRHAIPPRNNIVVGLGTSLEGS
jgi:hypothetical protein